VTDVQSDEYFGAYSGKFTLQQTFCFHLRAHSLAFPIRNFYAENVIVHASLCCGAALVAAPLAYRTCFPSSMPIGFNEARVDGRGLPPVVDDVHRARAAAALAARALGAYQTA